MIPPAPIEELRRVLLLLPVPICVLDRDTRYLAASSPYAKLCDTCPETLAGRQMLDFCPQNLVENARRDFDSLDAGEKIVDHQIVFRDRTFLVSVDPIYESNDRRAVAISVALTDTSIVENMVLDQAYVNVALSVAPERMEDLVTAMADFRRSTLFTETGDRQHSRERRRPLIQGTDHDGIARRGSLLGSRIPLSALIQTLAVAEHLSFRRAASTLGISQSSVSARVKALENELGTLLFERNTRGVRLTEAGRQFVEQIAAGVEQLEHAVKTAGMAAQGECGRLRIGVHALIPRSFLESLIGRYRENYLRIGVEITEGTARDAIMQLRAARLDIVFVAGTPDLPDCHSRPIWTEPLVAVLPDRHPLSRRPVVTWADLADETFLVRHGGTGPQVHDHILLRLAGRWPSPSILRFNVGQGTLLSMVGQGFGITIVGASSSLLPTSGVVFSTIADEPEPLAFSAVWSPHNRSTALRNLLNLAHEMGRSI